jgi:hypothetical protein
MRALNNFQIRLDIFGGNGWLLRDTIDCNGFFNIDLIDLKPEHYRFCLSLNHDSFFDCIHFHGVSAKYLIDPKLAATFKPWESRSEEVKRWVEENREEFIAENNISV